MACVPKNVLCEAVVFLLKYAVGAVFYRSVAFIVASLEKRVDFLKRLHIASIGGNAIPYLRYYKCVEDGVDFFLCFVVVFKVPKDVEMGTQYCQKLLSIQTETAVRLKLNA